MTAAFMKTASMSNGCEDRPGAVAGAPAVVVFCDRDRPAWLRLLRKGFRHCFVAVAAGPGWVIVDPLSSGTRLAVTGPLAGDAVAAWYRAHGCRAVVTRTRPAQPRALPAAPFTCVETVKRILGIRSRRTVTPWQLHRLVTEQESY